MKKAIAIVFNIVIALVLLIAVAFGVYYEWLKFNFFMSHQ